MHELVPIVLFVSMFSTAFGIYYLYSRENMAMLEKGFNPRERPGPHRIFIGLKMALLLIGAGLGLLLAFIADVNFFNGVGDAGPVYPAMIGIGGGVGLLVSFFIERKYKDKKVA